MLTRTERMLGAGSALASIVFVAIGQLLLAAAAAAPAGVLVMMDQTRFSRRPDGGEADGQDSRPVRGRVETLLRVVIVWPVVSAVAVFGLGALAEGGTEDVSMGLAVGAALFAIALTVISVRRSTIDEGRTGWFALLSGTLTVAAFAAIWALVAG